MSLLGLTLSGAPETRQKQSTLYLDPHPLLADRELKDISFPGCKPTVNSKLALTIGSHLIDTYFFLFEELRPQMRTETRFKQTKSVEGNVHLGWPFPPKCTLEYS